MSQERVERLESLLSRVQENRKRPRGVAAKPEIARAVAAAEPPKVAPAPEPIRPIAAEQPRAFGRPPVQQPPAAAAPRSVAPPPSPGKPVTPVAAPRAPIAQPLAARAPMQEAPGARKPGQDRTATPLEMAVAELDLAGAMSKPEPLKPAAAVQPPPTATTPGASMAPPIGPDEAFEARVIEPEPIREQARPIAQVVSRHAPQVDATFGAMLKRSLSLRPH